MHSEYAAPEFFDPRAQMQSRALKRTSLSLFDAPAYCDVPLAPRVPERTEIW
jgi:hypothetical protein